MDTKAVLPGEPQPAWWKVAQAVAWIVERNERSVERAAHIHLLRELTGLRPTFIGNELPFSLTAAPAELLRATSAGHVAIFGRLRGTGEAVRVAAYADYTLEDRKEGPCIVTPAYVGDRFWSDLWIRADECRSKWPGPPVPAEEVRGSEEADEVEKQPAGADDDFSESTIDGWLRGEMVKRRRVGEPKDRDTMVVAMMTEFRGRLSKTRAKELFTALPDDLKEKPGPRSGSRRNQDTGPKDPARCRN